MQILDGVSSEYGISFLEIYIIHRYSLQTSQLSKTLLHAWISNSAAINELQANSFNSLQRPLIKDQSLESGEATESGKVENEDPTQAGLVAIQDLVKDFPPSFLTASDIRYDGKHVAGHGVHRFAFWHARGHEHESAMLSHDMLGAKASSKVNVVDKFLKRFRKVLQAVGVLYEWIDAENYSRYRSLFQFFVEEGAVSLMQTTERNCFLGMSILTGVRVNPHRDSKDPLDGWAVIMAFGNFEGGYMEIPQIGYKFEVKPGDVVFMRSALPQHSISDTTSGLRFGVVLFNHQANFEERKRIEKKKMDSRIQNIQEKWLKQRSQEKEDTTSVSETYCRSMRF